MLLLQPIIIFYVISSFMRKNSLSRNRARHLRFSLNFNNIWTTFSSSFSKGHIYFPTALFYS